MGFFEVKRDLLILVVKILPSKDGTHPKTGLFLPWIKELSKYNDVHVISQMGLYEQGKVSSDIDKFIDEISQTNAIDYSEPKRGLLFSLLLFFMFLVGKIFYRPTNLLSVRAGIKNIPDLSNYKSTKVISLNSINTTGFTSYILSIFLNSPLYCFERNSKILTMNRKKTIDKIIWRRASNIISVSSELKKSIIRIDKRLKNKVIVLPDLTDFKPSSAKKNTNEKFIIASWTSWRPLKRLDLLVESFIEADIKESELWVIGGGISEGEKSDLLLKAKKNNTSIVFYGSLSRGDLFDLMEQVHLGIVTSDFETFGLQIIEAFSKGIPVVSTDCGGPSSIISSSFLGELASTNNKNSIINAIEYIYMNYHNYDSNRIIKHFTENYTKEAVVKKFISIIE